MSSTNTTGGNTTDKGGGTGAIDPGAKGKKNATEGAPVENQGGRKGVDKVSERADGGGNKKGGGGSSAG